LPSSLQRGTYSVVTGPDYSQTAHVVLLNNLQ
jgi:hypothetical protein